MCTPSNLQSKVSKSFRLLWASRHSYYRRQTTDDCNTRTQSSMREPSKARSYRSASPASSQTCVELPPSSHKDKADITSEHVMDLFSSPKGYSNIPSSPHEFTFPKSPSHSNFREGNNRSPLSSPTKPRYHPYMKSRGPSAATVQFAMDSLQGLTAHELNPGAALMVSNIILKSFKHLIHKIHRLRRFSPVVSQTCQMTCYVKVQWCNMPLAK